MNKRALILSAALLPTLALVSSARAGDWLQWRGPEHNGVTAESGGSHDWPADGPKVAWKAKVGFGFSSFVVGDGRVFTMGNADDKDTVFCFDAATGKELWKHSYRAELGDKYFEGGTTGTPTINGDRVYTLSRWGDAFCFNAKDGTVVWSKNVEKETGARQPDWGFGGAPLVQGANVYLNVGEAGLALDKMTGAIVWKSESKAAGYSTPLPIKEGGQDLAVFSSGQSYTAVDLSDGKPVWSTRWLAFTRYDGIVVTTEDLDELQRAGAETRAVLQALWQYVETGGVLLVIGNGKGQPEVPIPAAYRHSPLQTDGLLVYSVGFGRCIVSPDRDRKKWTPVGWDDVLFSSVGDWLGAGASPFNRLPQCRAALALHDPANGSLGPQQFENRWGVVQSAVSGTSIAFRNSRSFIDLNKTFAVVDDLGLPVKGLFALMVLFGLAMGPANLMWLTRLKRRIWLLWTVPALSLFFCLAVLGYMVVAEGWQGHARVGGITILDEGEKRATTLGRTAFYSPVTPGDGLHFSDTTEVQLLGDENAAWTSSCSIDWTNDQHLSRGWVTARVPSFFALRKSETLRRERLSLRREADGGLSVANALGVDIVQLWLADDRGRLYRAAAIAAGGSARLEDKGTQVAPAIPLQAWREIYVNTDWLLVAKNLRDEPAKYLGPGTYVAVVESSPFLEQGLKNAQVRPSESIVLGIMADPAGKR